MMQTKQTSGLKLKCFTCGLDGNLRPLEAENKYILVLLCPKLFFRAQPNTQYLICWDCEFMIVRIQQFQASLIKTYATREGYTTFQPVKGLSHLKLRGIETIDVPKQIVPANQPVLCEIAEVKLEPETIDVPTQMLPANQPVLCELAEVDLEPETIVIKIEEEECVDCNELIQASILEQEPRADSTDTANEADILMNDDSLMTPIQKNKIVEIEEPPQKVLNNRLIAQNESDYRPKKVIINIPGQKSAHAYREVPNLIPNEECFKNIVLGRGRCPPTPVKSKGTILNVLKGKESILDIKKDKEMISNLSKSDHGIVIKQIIPSISNPPREQVDPDCEQRLGFYDDNEDEVKWKILSRTELKAYRFKKALGIFKGCKYKCERCVEKFNSQENLDEHNKKHDISRGTSLCEVCKQRFPDDNSRNEHYKQHFIIFECLKCQYQNCDRIQISEHIRRRHAVSFFHCKKCNAVFKTLNEKRKHILYVHSKKRSCEECNRTFLNVSLLNRHIANSHRFETTDCTICKKKIRKNYLALHMRNTHRDTRDSVAYCVVCEKSFKSQKGYENHFKTSLKHNTVEQIGLKKL